ncbi:MULTISPECIES: TIGR04255 family protein [unclassified Mesorhizobium]|uniref:TIGR04255 family protein n=1 Tax=unclassified Mesorhizobium TaxID=325217 RepID=UPI0033360114
MTKLPVALERDPIANAVFEIRFSSDVTGISDILPGLMFTKLRGRYDRVVTLPAGEMPAALRAQLPNIEYQGLKSLVGKRSNINFAERSLVIELVHPYWGWKAFKELICEILSTVRDTGLVSTVDRCSLRYVNILEGTGSNSVMDVLNVSGSVGNFKIKEDGFHLRVETILDDGALAIIQVANSALIEIKDSVSDTKLSGILLDVDCILTSSLEDFWRDFSDIIDMVHADEKKVFFGMLNDRTLKAFGPKWE